MQTICRSKLYIMACAIGVGMSGCAEQELVETGGAPEEMADTQELALSFRPGLSVYGPETLTTSEQGGKSALWVRLSSPPRAAVSVSLTIDDASEATVQPQSLRFTPFSWWLPRKVIVTGVADLVLDGDSPFQLSLQTSSDDPGYAALPAVVRAGKNMEAALFHGLGSLPGGEPTSVVRALDASGNVAVGSGVDASGTRAARWTPAGSLQALPGLASSALGVSADGQLIVGSLADSRWQGGYAAVLWRAPDAQPEYFHAPLGEPAHQLLWFTAAMGVTDAGDAFGQCQQHKVMGVLLVCRTPVVNDNFPGVNLFGAITPDGAHLVGSGLPGRTAPGFGRATLDTVALPSPADCISPCDARGHDLSDDATRVVGTVSLQLQSQETSAFVYSAAEGTRRLPDLPAGIESSSALTISGDGSVIGGFGTSAAGQEAVLWRAGQPFAVSALLRAAQVQTADGWQLSEVVALSRDGRVLVGNGLNPTGQREAWRAVLP